MNIIIALFGLLILLLGLLGIIRPSALIALVDRPWRTPAGLYMAVAFRATIGVVLIAGATGTRFPWVLRTLGILSLLTATVIPFLGYQRVRKFIDWWVVRSAGFIRCWSVVALVFGAFLIYAVSGT